jgi:hypothetical protein
VFHFLSPGGQLRVTSAEFPMFTMRPVYLRFRKDYDRAACQRAMLLLVGTYEDKSMGENTVRRVPQAA